MKPRFASARATTPASLLLGVGAALTLLVGCAKESAQSEFASTGNSTALRIANVDHNTTLGTHLTPLSDPNIGIENDPNEPNADASRHIDSDLDFVVFDGVRSNGDVLGTKSGQGEGKLNLKRYPFPVNSWQIIRGRWGIKTNRTVAFSTSSITDTVVISDWGAAAPLDGAGTKTLIFALSKDGANSNFRVVPRDKNVPAFDVSLAGTTTGLPKVVSVTIENGRVKAEVVPFADLSPAEKEFYEYALNRSGLMDAPSPTPAGN